MSELLDGITLRRLKGMPLTIDELDNNFDYLSSHIQNMDLVSDGMNLLDDEQFLLGTDGKFSMYSADGVMIIKDEVGVPGEGTVFEIRGSSNEKLLEVLGNGTVKAGIGGFVIDAEDLNVNFNNLDSLSLNRLSFDNLSDLPTTNYSNGTLVVYGGELYVKGDD